MICSKRVADYAILRIGENMRPLERRQLSPNVFFTSVRDPKFKRDRLSVRLLTPHGTPSTAANALVPFLLRRGCASFPDFTLLNERLCELYDAVLSTDVGVIGASQACLLSISTLDDAYALGGDRVVEACASLLRDLVMAPALDADGLFPERDFEVERQSLLDAIDAEQNDKRRYALLRYARMIFEGELASLPRYGSREAIAALTREDVTAAYRQLVDTGAVEILFVGGGDPAPALDVFAEAFGARERTPLELPPLHRTESFRERTERMPVAQAKLVMGWSSGIPFGECDAARVMAALLGGTVNSLLFTEVREKLSLCYYCGASYDRLRGVLTVDSGIEEANREAAENAIRAQIARLVNGDYPDETLEAIRLAMTDSLTAVEDSLSSIESWALTCALYGGRDITDEIAALNAVTREEISAAAARLAPDTTYCLAGNGEAPTADGEEEE